MLQQQKVGIWDGNASRDFLDSRGLQHLREGDGRYWTGWVYDTGRTDEPSDVYWPHEHTTYTAAAVVLAVDALGETHGHATPGSGIMRGTSLAPHFAEIALECGCESVRS